jgi:dihydrofolate reductase
VAKYPLVTYVTDGITSAMAQAKAAAGDSNVLVHGVRTAQTALVAGVLDELQIHQVPVLFGGGRRLFELLPSRVELEIVPLGRLDSRSGHRASRGTSTVAFGLPQPVTGSQPGPAR